MISFAKYTDFGGRPKNEDTCGTACDENSYLFVVADGLGGHGGGEVASRIAVDAFCNLFLQEGWSAEFFSHAFSLAQKLILEEQVRQHAPSRMKTTLVALVIHDNVAYWAHVGDSRLYYFKNSRIKIRTLDHSVPQQLALRGEIKDGDIRHHEDRNRLMRVLGIKGEIPRFEEGKPLKLSGSQHFLLCTDGYWELVLEKDMENLLQGQEVMEAWISDMNKVIRRNGAHTEMDNYTCIAVHSKRKGLFGF